MQTDYYSEIGHLLRVAREERQLTLEQAADQLHIRARYLHALEQGRFDELPGGIPYVRGYLRTYASFLKLDKREILRRFEQVEDILVKQRFYLPQVFSKAKDPGQWAVWGGCVLALVLYLFWLGFIKPERVEVSMVEAPPKHDNRPVFVPLASHLDVTCVHPQEDYYPLCHIDWKSPLTLLVPLTGEELIAMQQAKKVRKKKITPPPEESAENSDE